jgi:hypothetical protein
LPTAIRLSPEGNGFVGAMWAARPPGRARLGEMGLKRTRIGQCLQFKKRSGILLPTMCQVKVRRLRCRPLGPQHSLVLPPHDPQNDPRTDQEEGGRAPKPDSHFSFHLLSQLSYLSPVPLPPASSRAA